MQSDLASVVYVVRPKVTGFLPRTTGHLLHAAYLDALRRLGRAELARILHAPTRNKPFTISPIAGGVEKVDRGLLRVPADAECWFRVTSLSREVSSQLLSLDADVLRCLTLHHGGVNGHSADRKIMRRRLELEVLKRIATDEEHTWAAQATYHILAYGRLNARPWLADRIKMRFATPTTFRAGIHNVPLPLPHLIFLGLQDKWNQYAPMHLKCSLPRHLNRVVTPSRFALTTETLEFHSRERRYMQVGFVGECEFLLQLDLLDQQTVHTLHALADFAFFAGVGYKTTMGMGQAMRARQADPPW